LRGGEVSTDNPDAKSTIFIGPLKSIPPVNTRGILKTTEQQLIFLATWFFGTLTHKTPVIPPHRDTAADI